ncbi:MAG: DUF935 family protein [Ignavibacteria bacterium CHB3]|nr:DUF935 family protein [Ignavibacteria bacterium CHB3]
MKYKNPNLSNSLLPTLAQIKSYIKTATITDDLKSRDVRPLMSFLQRLPAADRFLLGLIQTRKVAVLGFDYTIKFPDEMNVPESEQKKLDQMKARFLKSNMKKTFNSIMNGILFGMSATNLEWENVKGFGSMVTKRKNLELTELDFSFDDNTRLDLIITEQTSFRREPLDPDTHIFVRFNPLEGIDNDFPGSFLRSNMLYVWLKYTDAFNWASANEKWGDPLVVAQYDKERVESADLSTIQAGLQTLGTSGKAMFSKDIELKFIEAMRSGITDMHEKFINSINDEMSVSILGQTLTTDVSKIGSFAAAKVHNFVRQDILWSDILEFEDVLTTQYVMKDWLLNYGEPKVAFPQFEFLTDEIEDKESNARIFEGLKSTLPLIKVPKDELEKKTGFSILLPTDEGYNEAI